MKPFIPQKNHDGCAVAVLTMVLNYFGIHLQYNQVESNFINKNLSFIDLIEFLNRYNVKSIPKVIASKNINQLQDFPSILHLKNHFIIVYEKINNNYYYADPAGIGIRKGSLCFKSRSWTGNYLDLSNNKINPPSKIEFHLPYIIRLIMLNLIIILIIIIMI